MLGAKAVARAKINLFLDVGPRRRDGYHEVRSVMQSLELADELYFRRTDGSRSRIFIRCNDRCVPTTGDNLVWGAIEAFARDTGAMSEGGVEVFINKRIPVGAGLAGGSADAAATVLAMNHIWELELSGEAMGDIGARVGSDVPFCLAGGTAFVSGRGEKIERLEPLPPYQVVLASSDEEVSTAEVYRRFDELGGGAGPPAGEGVDGLLEGLLEGIRNHDFEAIQTNLHNSLESATIAADRVGQFKEAARKAGAAATSMTGSGPTVFALVTGLEEAAEVAWELEKIAPVTIITSFAERGAEISA